MPQDRLRHRRQFRGGGRVIVERQDQRISVGRDGVDDPVGVAGRLRDDDLDRRPVHIEWHHHTDEDQGVDDSPIEFEQLLEQVVVVTAYSFPDPR